MNQANNQSITFRPLSARAGFSMTELLTMVAVVAIVSSVSLVGITEFRAKARDDRRISDLKLIQTTLELYRVDNERGALSGLPYPRYPLLDNNVNVTTCGVSNNLVLDANCNGLVNNPTFRLYLTNVPIDPVRQKPYPYFSPACVRPGSGTASDPMIISYANSLIYYTLASLTDFDPSLGPENVPCPDGSGWTPYAIYALLEKPRAGSLGKQGINNLSGSDRAVIYAPTQPIFLPGSTGSAYIGGYSRCFPAIGACSTGY